MAFIADVLQKTANAAHKVGINTPELGLTEATGGANVNVSYKLPDSGKIVSYASRPRGNQTINGKVYNFDGANPVLVSAGGGGSAPAAGGSYAPGTGVGTGVGTLTTTGAQDALAGRIRNEIAARGGDIDSVYNDLFSSLDNVVRGRAQDLEGTYGDQLSKASQDYTAAIPMIEQSYATLGAADSTDRSDAKDKANNGFKETTATIGKNKQEDLAKLGQYREQQAATLTAGKNSAARNVARAGETTDTDALNGFRSDLEKNLDDAGVTKAQLTSDTGAKQALTGITADNGRYAAATSALDDIIKSSMSGSVKQAAVDAVTTSAGLSDDEKKKVQATYGNTYAEQAAL